MQGLSQRHSVCCFVFLATALSAPLLVGQRAQQSIAGEIHGQVRVENQPARRASWFCWTWLRACKVVWSGVGRSPATMTDTAGKSL